MIVYKATNKTNGKYYFGKTVRNLSHAKARHYSRSRDGYDTYFYNAMRKYPEWEWEIMYEGIDDSDIQEVERVFIQLHQANDKRFGYNTTPGGDGGAGYKVPEELRGRCSRPGQKNGRWNSELDKLRVKAGKLREDGKTYPEIIKMLGLKSRAQARNLVNSYHKYLR